MPIYKGSTLINSVHQGNTSISNVYWGNTPVYSSISYPYKVLVNGPINQLESNLHLITTLELPDAMFSLNNSENIGNIWYGVVLSSTMFDQMIQITDDEPTNPKTHTMLKTAWYDFISLMIGFNLPSTDMSAFTIADVFYALDLSEWNINTQQPTDPTNTHAWKFTSNGDNFDILYITLTQADFIAIQSIIQGGAQVSTFYAAPYGKDFGLIAENLVIGVLISSQAVNFTLQHGLSLNIEYITNNNQRITSNKVQSLIDNFNFAVRSLLWGCASEVMRLNWDLALPTDAETLVITNYTPPALNVSGELTTQLVPISSVMGE